VKLRRLLIVLAVALVALAGVSAIGRLARRGPGIDQAHCYRIKQGMRRDQVVALLGGPPGVYRSGQLVAPDPPDGGTGGGRAIWHGDEGLILVEFGDDGTVATARFTYWFGPSLPQRVIDYIRGLLP
jgi:hypothetical protein